MYPSDYDFAINEVKRYIEGEVPEYSSEYRLKCNNGKYKWVAGFYQINLENNNIVYIVERITQSVIEYIQDKKELK